MKNKPIPFYKFRYSLENLWSTEIAARLIMGNDPRVALTNEKKKVEERLILTITSGLPATIEGSTKFTRFPKHIKILPQYFPPYLLKWGASQPDIKIDEQIFQLVAWSSAAIIARGREGRFNKVFYSTAGDILFKLYPELETKENVAKQLEDLHRKLNEKYKNFHRQSTASEIIPYLKNVNENARAGRPKEGRSDFIDIDWELVISKFEEK